MARKFSCVNSTSSDKYSLVPRPSRIAEVGLVPNTFVAYFLAYVNNYLLQLSQLWMYSSLGSLLLFMMVWGTRLHLNETVATDAHNKHALHK